MRRIPHVRTTRRGITCTPLMTLRMKHRPSSQLHAQLYAFSPLSTDPNHHLPTRDLVLHDLSCYHVDDVGTFAIIRSIVALHYKCRINTPISVYTAFLMFTSIKSALSMLSFSTSALVASSALRHRRIASKARAPNHRQHEQEVRETSMRSP